MKLVRIIIKHLLIILFFSSFFSCGMSSSNKNRNSFYDFYFLNFIGDLKGEIHYDKIISNYFYNPDSLTKSTYEYSVAYIHNARELKKKGEDIIIFKNENIVKYTNYASYDPNFCDCNYIVYLDSHPEYSFSLCMKFNKIYSIICIGEFNPNLKLKWLR